MISMALKNDSIFSVSQAKTSIKQRFYDNKRDPLIEFIHFDASIERKATEIDETSLRVLKYKSPSFIASVTFRFPTMKSDECWKVGFVQACDFMLFQNHYGDFGYSSWEFPQLAVRDASMINDSCGRNYPWYGSRNQVVTIEGPIFQSNEHTISMRDLFAPWIPWDIPTYEGDQSCLTHIYRHQRFYVWLCAMNCTKNELLILRTIRWSQTIEISVNPTLCRGRRAKLISDAEPDQPIFLKRNLLIPSCALQGPSANNAQLLLWRPSKGQPIVVVHPKHHDTSTTKYMYSLSQHCHSKSSS